MTIVCFGEMLIRLSPKGDGGLDSAESFAVHVAGAEANVAISLASLGSPSRMATILPDNALGERARNCLREHHVDVSACIERPGRIGTFFVESPRAGREGGFFYDRAHSAFAHEVATIDWDKVLEGATWLHLSGITAALGSIAVLAMRQALAVAQSKGVTISFDSNYRPLLWEGREDEGAALLKEFSSAAQLLFANGDDARLMLGERCSTKDFLVHFPAVRWVASTVRAGQQGSERLGAVLTTHETCWTTHLMKITPYVDRIGAGDAFAAALIHGLSQDWNEEYALRFAKRACIMKHGITGDFSTLSEASIAQELLPH